MLNRYFCLDRRASFRAGLWLVALGVAHLALSGFWVRYFQLTGRVRSISVEFVAGLVVGLGIVLLASSLGSDNRAAEDGSLLDSERQAAERSGQQG